MSNIVESWGNSFDVSSIKTSNRNSTICSHIDTMVVSKLINLSNIKTSIGEHTDLRCNVSPVVFITQRSKVLYKCCSHFLHSSGHVSKILMPACGKFSISQNVINDSCTMDWWIWVHWSGNLLNSWLAFSGFIGSISEESYATSSFTIKTKVLGKWLEQADPVGLWREKS